MRTKHVLMAMALPALFAACTSDEFMDQPAQGNLDGRAVLGNLQVNVAEDAATRFAWDVAGWTFEDGDQFGAAVTDPTTVGTVVNDQMLGNYIFSKNGNGYTTTSQMVEGTYLFYSYNQPESFVNKNTRDLIAFDLTTQTADLNDPKKAVSDNQLFFSPLYFIEAENTTAENTIALPLRFIPYYSTAAFRIKNSTGAAFSISQIVLNGTFNAKGEIDPTEINKYKLYYSVPEGGNAYDLTALNPDGTKTDAEVKELYETAYMDKSFAKAATLKTANSLVLDCNDYELANGKEIVAYMQVPVGKQTNMSASIIVRVNGVSRQIDVTETAIPEEDDNGDPTGKVSIASSGIKNAEFLRTKTKAVFGVETNGNLKVLDVKAENLQDAGGFYVDSNAELLNVLNSERGEINFYNTGDVEINDDIIEALNLYTAGAVTFSNPIEINVKSAEALTLSSSVGAGITFAGDVTVNGNVGLGANVELKDNLTVESGKVILSGAGMGAASEVTVDGGELELAAAAVKLAKIDVNNGTLTVTSSQNVGTDGIGSLDMTADKDKTTTLNINGTATKNVTLDYKSTGNATLEASNVNINAYGKLATSEKGVVVNGKVTNYGVFGEGWAIVIGENAVVENYKTIGDARNEGLIVMKDVWNSTLTLNSTSAGNGYIDNTQGCDVPTDKTNTVFSYATGTVSSVSTRNVNVVVLKDATVADETEIEAGTANVLLLGNNTFGTMSGAGVNITAATLQIGLAASGDAYQELATVAAGVKFTTQNTPDAYSKGMTTTNNSGTWTLTTLKCYGGTNNNAGTIEYTASGSIKGNWNDRGTMTEN